MEDRLQWIRLEPKAWATGSRCAAGWQAHALVERRYPQAECFVVEAAPHRPPTAQAHWPALVAPLGGPRAALRPVPDGGVQMLWANMACTWRRDPQALLAHWHRALAVDGFLMFSCLGRTRCANCAACIGALGWPPAGQEFTDMHDWGDMLVARRLRRAGDGHGAHHADLGDAGSGCSRSCANSGANLHPARFPALRGRGWRGAAERELDDPGGAGRPPGPDLRDHLRPCAQAGAEGAGQQQSAVSLEDMRAMLQRSAGRSESRALHNRRSAIPGCRIGPVGQCPRYNAG